MVAGIAVSATSPVVGGDVSGQSAVTDAVLTTASASLDASALGSLVLNGPLASGSGSVTLVVDLPAEAASGLTFSLSNDETGEANDVDVLDPALQPEASIGIGAFDGCSPEAPCDETFSLHFERIDDGIADDLPRSCQLAVRQTETTDGSSLFSSLTLVRSRR